jgi:uncharacterized protein YegL
MVINSFFSIDKNEFIEINDSELIILLLDVSPSMFGCDNNGDIDENSDRSRIEALYTSTIDFIDIIAESQSNFVGHIIAFSNTVQDIISLQNFRDINLLPELIQPSEGTDIIKALEYSLDISSNWRRQYTNSSPFVICITDGGDTNRDNAKDLRIDKIKRKIDEQNINLFLLGVNGADMRFLRKINSKRALYLKNGFNEIVQKLKKIIENETNNEKASNTHYAELLKGAFIQKQEISSIKPQLFLFVGAISVLILILLFSLYSHNTIIEHKTYKAKFVSKIIEKTIELDTMNKELLTIKNVQGMDTTGKKIQADIIAIEYLTKNYTWKSERNKELFADNRGKTIEDICHFLFSKPAFKNRLETSKGVICIGNSCEREDIVISNDIRLVAEESRAGARSSLLANCVKENTTKKPIFTLNLGQHKRTGKKETKYQRLILIAIATEWDIGVDYEYALSKALIKADIYLPYSLSLTNYSLVNMKDTTFNIISY